MCCRHLLRSSSLAPSAAVNLNDGASRSWVSAPLPLYWYLRVSARWCVAPSVNARTARAFLFIRLSALQYMYLSDYGSLRLRWNREPWRSRFSLLRSCFRCLVRTFFRHPSTEETSVHLHLCICSRGKMQKPCHRARASAIVTFLLYLSVFLRCICFPNKWYE